jgi:hypothetical protein
MFKEANHAMMHIDAMHLGLSGLPPFCELYSSFNKDLSLQEFNWMLSPTYAYEW